MVTVTGQSLVDGVVHDLVHQMVQTPLAGRADIHSSLQTFQDLDLAGVVFMVRRSICVGAGNDFLCHFLSPFCFVISLRFVKKQICLDVFLICRLPAAEVSPKTVRWGGTLLPQAIGRAMEWPEPCLRRKLLPHRPPLAYSSFVSVRRLRAAGDSSERYTVSTGASAST